MLNEKIESEIRALLASSDDAIALSNALFAPGGLFSRFATDKEQRRALTQTPLFKEAQQRVATLREVEARRFSQAVEAFAASKPGQKLIFKVEQVPHN